jgi:hypothetical protein
VGQQHKETNQRKGVGQEYEFTGMHHIFAHYTVPITTVAFAHEDKDLLAFASMSGHICICSAFHCPAVVSILKGHSGGISGTSFWPFITRD